MDWNWREIEKLSRSLKYRITKLGVEKVDSISLLAGAASLYKEGYELRP